MISKKIMLIFPKEISSKPFTSNLSKQYNLTFNIMSAQIFPRQEGRLILELSGEENDFENGINYLKTNGISIQFIEDNITIDYDKCYHCGFCLPVCPTNALMIKDKKTMKIELNKSDCIACGYCVKVCPVKAIELYGFELNFKS